MEKKNLMVSGLDQRWFRRPNKDFYRKIISESHFWGRYGSVVLQQQREDMMQELSVF